MVYKLTHYHLSCRLTHVISDQVQFFLSGPQIANIGRVNILHVVGSIFFCFISVALEELSLKLFLYR